MKKYYYLLVTAILLLLSPVISLAGEGEASITLGYIGIDEEGNKGVNQETYNLYDGFNLSISDLRYQMENGINLFADLRNTTLDNRNLRFGGYKPGLFKLHAFHNNYRRIYDFDGNHATDRKREGFQASVSPVDHVKINGGYTKYENKGSIDYSTDLINELYPKSVDYSHTTFNLGALLYCEYGNINTSFSSSEFTDNANSFDRESNTFTITGFSQIPTKDWIHLSGGYVHRKDTMTVNDLILKTNQLWGGVRAYLKNNQTVEYKIHFARTDHSENLIETDNWINILSYSKSFKRIGGFRVAVENRIVDDLIDRTVSNGIILDGWYNATKKLFLKAKLSLRSKDVKTGTTLIGDESYSRHLLTAKYRDEEWGDLTLRADRRIRKNDDILSRVDYTAATSILNLKKKKYGKLNLTYSYYLGEFENMQAGVIGYEFSDHIITGTIYPRSYKNIDFSFGGTYNRSRRQQDIEKFSVNFSGVYHIPQGYDLEAKYNVFNYDDYLLNGNYYTANIFEVNITKPISF